MEFSFLYRILKTTLNTLDYIDITPMGRIREYVFDSIGKEVVMA
jgi:hypothetical protein